jgi:hypothetical protein
MARQILIQGSKDLNRTDRRSREFHRTAAKPRLAGATAEAIIEDGRMGVESKSSSVSVITPFEPDKASDCPKRPKSDTNVDETANSEDRSNRVFGSGTIESGGSAVANGSESGRSALADLDSVGIKATAVPFNPLD